MKLLKLESQIFLIKIYNSRNQTFRHILWKSNPKFLSKSSAWHHEEIDEVNMITSVSYETASVLMIHWSKLAYYCRVYTVFVGVDSHDALHVWGNGRVF